MAKTVLIGDLVACLEKQVDSAVVIVGAEMENFEDLSRRVEVANGNAIYEMADRAHAYLIALSTVLKVIKDGGGGQ